MFFFFIFLHSDFSACEAGDDSLLQLDFAIPRVSREASVEIQGECGVKAPTTVTRKTVCVAMDYFFALHLFAFPFFCV